MVVMKENYRKETCTLLEKKQCARRSHPVQCPSGNYSWSSSSSATYIGCSFEWFKINVSTSVNAGQYNAPSYLSITYTKQIKFLVYTLFKIKAPMWNCIMHYTTQVLYPKVPNCWKNVQPYTSTLFIMSEINILIFNTKVTISVLAS